MFLGFFEVEGASGGVFLVRTSSQAPAEPDSAPNFRIYAPTGPLQGATGNCASLFAGSVGSATDASPIVIGSPQHGLVTGDRVTVSQVAGNTAANATWSVIAIDQDSFSLTNSVGSGSYSGGGQWVVTGLYSWAFDVTTANGFSSGQTYFVELTALVGGFPFSEVHSFIVT